MSLVFAIVLGLYATARLVFWLRGQCRLRLKAHELPQIPQRCSPPAHIRPRMQRFFEQCAQTHRTLLRHRREIAITRITDPDGSFGFLRNARYRRAILEAAVELRSWLRHSELFFGMRHNGSRAWPIGPECAEATLQAMAAQLHLATHSRALEPFDLGDVERLDQALQSFVLKLELTLEKLTQSRQVSYRNAFLGNCHPAVPEVSH